MIRPLNPHITPAEVVERVGQLEHASEQRYDRDHRHLAAGIVTLTTFFGPEWVEKRVKKNGFINPPVERRLDGFKRQARITSLAEHLVNLQHIDGLEWCLRELRTDSIETGFAKLYGAGMVRRAGVSFRFVVPSGKIRADYDAEAALDGTRFPVEMKARIEGKAPSPKAIADSLKGARSQMPRETPNLIFLRLPEAWGQSDAGREAVTEAVYRDFANSGSIGAVVAH
jgi:hypothetical protein